MKRNITLFKTNLKFNFSLIILLEIAVSILVAAFLVHEFTGINSDNILLPLTLWQVLQSILIGSTIYDYMNRWIFNPVTRLSKSMSRVSDGDFSVKLHTDSSIDEINNLYSNFNIMVSELNNTEILQTDFVSNVSHEFKTPINAIEGYAMLLQDDRCSDEERRTYTDKIIFNTRRLSGLVGNILLLSRLDNQAIVSGKTTFRLDEQIRQSILLLENEWSVKNLDFDVDLDKVDYSGNEGIMMHIWNNLIGNAVKFTPEGGKLGINMHLKNNMVQVNIEDSGPGIKDSDKKHIFDKFYQGESSRSEKGNGLGLPLVKKIVDLHSGNIKAENMEQGGCRFTVELPL